MVHASLNSLQRVLRQKALVSHCSLHMVASLQSRHYSAAWWRTTFDQDLSKVCRGSDVLTAELFPARSLWAHRRGSLLRLSHVALVGKGFAFCDSSGQAAVLGLICEKQLAGTGSLRQSYGTVIIG